jgi:3-oxoacyl-[acyl-carrier protein] reductase
MFDLTGKTALITGAGSKNGIGFASAELMARLGANVFLTGQSDRVYERAEELKNKGFNATAFTADLTDESQVIKMIEHVDEKYKNLNILVNNAGMTSQLDPMDSAGEMGSIDQISISGFQKTIDRNLLSVFMVTKLALELIRKSKNGRIIVVSSVTGGVMAMRNEIAYATAKSALGGFIKSLALDEAVNNITVNSVLPGWIATDSQTEYEKIQGNKTPLGRSGTAAEVASLIAWLSCDESSYLTGQSIVVDGGNSISEERA